MNMKKKKFALGLLLCCAIVLALSPVTVAAQATGDVTINGVVPETISISVPANFNLGNLVPDQVVSPAQTVTVTSNKTGWSLTVKESGTSPDGKMARVGDSKTLTAVMEVRGGDQTGYTPLSSTVTLKSGSTVTSATISDIYLRQYVVAGDEPGTYTITLTFTATP